MFGSSILNPVSRKENRIRRCIAVLLAVAVASLIAGCGGGSSGSTPVAAPVTPPTAFSGPAWYGYGRDSHHTDLAPTIAQGGVAAQNLSHVVWETPIDLVVDQTNAIHYGSPMITSANTVLVGVKTAIGGSFQMEARKASNGNVIWTAASDYILPPLIQYIWIPSFGSTLTTSNHLYMPGAGGKVSYIANPDATSVTPQTMVFYGSANYAASANAFNSTVFINTPITADSSGNIFFGFTVSGTNPAGLSSGFARIGADGVGSWVSANVAVNQAGPYRPAMNAAPALSNDNSTIYVAVATVQTSPTDNPTGYLLALDSTTLATKGMVQLIDPFTQVPAYVTDSSTASPMVGPDGDVFYGVLESNMPAHHARGWLLHFDATLATLKIPGSFGWDDTPSIVPAGLVTSYTGSSTYLLLTKYNNYADPGIGGDGKNKMAILDPNATETDPIESTSVMNEVMTVLGPSTDTVLAPANPGAVREWCVNSAAVDPNTHSIMMNSEDGMLYRWDLNTGLLSQKIWLDNGYGQAYTPTAIGADGTVYSINNSSLIAVTN